MRKGPDSTGRRGDSKQRPAMNDASRFGFALCLLGLVAGCSSDGKKGGEVSLGEPALEVRSVGRVSQPSGEIDVELGCDAMLPVVVSVTNFTLRPPDACFGYPQCGQVAVLVDPVLEDGGVVGAAAEQLAATSFVDVDFGALDAPEGEHLLRVELREDGATTAALGADGKPLASEIRVRTTLASDCDAGPDAVDPDASGDAEPAPDAG